MKIAVTESITGIDNIQTIFLQENCAPSIRTSTGMHAGSTMIRPAPGSLRGRSGGACDQGRSWQPWARSMVPGNGIVLCFIKEHLSDFCGTDLRHIRGDARPALVVFRLFHVTAAWLARQVSGTKPAAGARRRVFRLVQVRAPTGGAKMTPLCRQRLARPVLTRQRATLTPHGKDWLRITITFRITV